MDFANMLSLPLADGTRLQLGDCFTLTDQYPFFSADGLENYNARLCWCDKSKSMRYDIYPVSDRVRGCALGGGVDEIDWGKIQRRSLPTNDQDIP